MRKFGYLKKDIQYEQVRTYLFSIYKTLKAKF